MHNQLVVVLMKKLEVPICIILFLLCEPFPFPRLVENIVSLISYGFLFFIIIGRWKKLLYVATSDISLLLLVGVALLSVFWSANPANTANESRLMLRSTLFGVYLAMQYTPREQMRLLSWAFGISMILSLATSLLFPSYGIQVVNGHLAWQGIYTHKQIFGRQMGIALSLFLINILDRQSSRWIAIIPFGLAFTLLLLSASKTGLLLFLFSLSLIPVDKFIIKQRKYRLLLFLIFFLICGIFVFLITVNFEYIVVNLLGKDLDLNGRIPIWKLAFEKGLEQPWLGYGYRGFWSSDVSDYVIYNTWAGFEEGFQDRSIEFHAHNGLIDLFLELGILGLLLFLLNYYLLIIRILTLLLLTRNIQFLWLLQLAGMYWITNLSESRIILSSTNTLWILYVLIVLSSAVEHKRMKRNNCLTSSPEALKIAG